MSPFYDICSSLLSREYRIISYLICVTKIVYIPLFHVFQVSFTLKFRVRLGISVVITLVFTFVVTLIVTFTETFAVPFHSTPLIKAGFKLGSQADSDRLPITNVPPSPQPSWLEQGGFETTHQYDTFIHLYPDLLI